MIENDLKSIRKHHTTTNKKLKVISDWQTNHEKEDNKHFKEINNAIKELPNTVLMAKAVQDAVQTTVNGKIDAIARHLTEQDANLEILSKKIKPFDGFRSYLIESARIIMYCGGLAIAIAGIMELLKMMGIIK